MPRISRGPHPLTENAYMVNLGYAVIPDWLMSIEMFEDALNGDGKCVKHPTAP